MDLSVDRVQLSESMKFTASEDVLRERVIHLILDFRMCYVKRHLEELQIQLKRTADFEEQMRLMQEIKDMQEIRNVLARKLGRDIVV